MIHLLQKQTQPTTNKYCGGFRIVINRVYIVLLLSQYYCYSLTLKVCNTQVIVIDIMVVYRPIAMCAVVVI